MPFGQLMAEFQVSGWVHHVTFSPSGCRLAFVAHDSSISYVDANQVLSGFWNNTSAGCVLKMTFIQDNTVAHTLRTSSLPFTSAEWVTENSLVAAVRFYTLHLSKHAVDIATDRIYPRVTIILPFSSLLWMEALKKFVNWTFHQSNEFLP